MDFRALLELLGPVVEELVDITRFLYAFGAPWSCW